MLKLTLRCIFPFELLFSQEKVDTSYNVVGEYYLTSDREQTTGKAVERTKLQFCTRKDSLALLKSD